MDRRIENMTFGVELECYLPAGYAVREACRLLAAATGKNFRVVENYREIHTPTPDWTVVHDGTLNGHPNGWEFRTPSAEPFLRGDAGMAELKKVCEVLNSIGTIVDTNCGTHVHVGVGSSNPDLNFLKRLLKAYITYEPAFDSIMPRSRRANSNGMIGSLLHLSLARIDAARDLDELLRVFGERGRYHKLNLHSLWRRPTVEFRQHSGTIEFEKISNWILLVLRMVAAAQDGTIAVPTTANGSAQVNRARRGSKAWQIGEMLLSPQGCTAQEAMAAVGWLKISMKAQARICGLQIVSERMGRNLRFFARSMAVTTSAAMPIGPATLSNLLNTLGCSIAEQSYFNSRAAHFAQRENRMAA